MFSLKVLKERIQRFYPYDDCSLLMKLKVVSRAVMIKFFNNFVYSDISLVEYMKKFKGLSSDKEFLAGYNASHEGFEGLWNSKPRETQEQIENFYREQEADIWRQVYLSKYGHHKRKYVLMVYSVISCYSKNPNLKILDYGCGCGIYGHYLYKKGYRDITLADIESSTFQFVQKALGKNFKYIKIDDPNPLNEIYDVILLIDCLAHAFNPFEIIKHVFNHLKKSGLLIIYYEKDVGLTHLTQAAEQRQEVMNYIYSQCQCLKKDEVFIKI